MDTAVSITVSDAQPIEVPWNPGMNVQQALEATYNRVENANVFSFAIEFFGTYQSLPYGPLGYMVVMLNGTYDLPDQSQYWALYINNIPATKGVDNSFLNSGDSVLFLNEPYSEQKHSKSAVALRHKIQHTS